MAGDYQGTAVVNHTSAMTKYTRITEHKHFENNDQEITIVSMEYPIDYLPERVPYYPINDEKNNALYERYREATDTSIILGGRLGSYRYYDMDQVIAQALTLVERSK
jgi:UDP-galactopyranose mutase